MKKYTLNTHSVVFHGEQNVSENTSVKIKMENPKGGLKEVLFDNYDISGTPEEILSEEISRIAFILLGVQNIEATKENYLKLIESAVNNFKNKQK